MLTITQLRKFEGGQWRSDNLETLPTKINEDSIFWVDAEDPSEAEIDAAKKSFRVEEFQPEGI